MSGDKCVPLSRVREELSNLADMAREAGDSKMEKVFKEQLTEMSKAGGARRRRTGKHRKASKRNTRRRGRRGGATKTCHVITTAMMMTGGAAVTYLTYQLTFPVVSKSLPALCGEGVKDQVLSALLGVWDATLTCASRQAKWDALRSSVIKYVLGAEAMAVFTDKTILGKSKLAKYYNKLLKWNEVNVCPMIDAASSRTYDRVCSIVTVPYRAALTVGRVTAENLRVMREVFDEMHGVEHDDSGTNVGQSKEVSKMRDVQTQNTPPRASPAKVMTTTGTSPRASPAKVMTTTGTSPRASPEKVMTTTGASPMRADDGNEATSVLGRSASSPNLKRGREGSPRSGKSPEHRRTRSASPARRSPTGGRRTHRRRGNRHSRYMRR